MEPIIFNPPAQTIINQDQRLIDGIVNNDKSIINEIYQRYSSQVKTIVISNSGTTDDAKDVFQEVILSIFRQTQNGFLLRSSFGAFFLTACKRRWLNTLNSKYQSKTNHHYLDHNDIVDICSDVEEFELETRRYGMVIQKLKMMPEACKELIEQSLTRDEGGKYLSWIQIAETLDLSYGYVRKKASECKERLANMVKKDPDYKNLMNQLL